MNETLWFLIILAVGPVAIGIINLFLTRQAAWDARATSAAALETAKHVKEIHIAVNSEREKMVNEIRSLRDDIVRYAEQIATLRDQARREERP